MRLKPQDKTDERGNKRFPIDEHIQLECTYHPDTHEVVDYYINGVLVEQDNLIVVLADSYEDEKLQGAINDYEYDEAERRKMEGVWHPLYGRVA